ncbi:MAG: phosphoribosylamine--glycine ligase [Actinomycetota bacterium]|nr:phosphoribosylamine--glycine ligase [Actinomycetota bacterium]
MQLLVIGGGGREHALIWKLKQSPRVEKIYCVPGNGGIAELAECLPALAVDGALVGWAVRQGVDLVIIGPEAPLVAGMADEFEAAGLPVFGVCREAARLEGSKSFAKEIMSAAGVSTAAARAFTDLDEAVAYLETGAAPYVVKADGLAAGKGVIIAEDFEAARRAISDCLVDRRFGDAGRQVVIEEFLAGQEVSVLAFVDGKTIKAMPPAQDYKRVGDGDAGPNTGGMGAFAPAPFLDEDGLAGVVTGILEPTIKALARRGIIYKGVLYAGLMLTETGAKVLEFNTRFGDPETEALMPLFDGDLVEVMLSCAQGRLAGVDVPWSTAKSLTVVLASEGYPESPVTGREITGLVEAAKKDVVIFHAGTRLEGGKMLTSGGRVLNVSAVAGSFAEAREKVYEAVKLIKFEGMRYRSDIGIMGRGD